MAGVAGEKWVQKLPTRSANFIVMSIYVCSSTG
jgi:hypothetical protein